MCIKRKTKDHFLLRLSRGGHSSSRYRFLRLGAHLPPLAPAQEAQSSHQATRGESSQHLCSLANYDFRAATK